MRTLTTIVILTIAFSLIALEVALSDQQSHMTNSAGWRDAANSEPENVKQIISDHGGEWCKTQVVWEAKATGKAGTDKLGLGDPNLPCPAEGQCDNYVIRDNSIPGPYDPIIWVRLKFNVFAEDDGSNPAASQAEIDDNVDRLNADYLPARVQFIYETEFINSTQFRYFVNSEMNQMKFQHAESPSTKLNIYIVTIDADYIGIGTFPWDSDALTYRGGVVADNGYIGDNWALLSHEVGHCVGLWHTHHGVSEVNQCGGCYERAGTQSGDVLGDFCSDTDPTPVNYTCSPPGGTDPCNGIGWGDTDLQNYMGYSPDYCQTEFSIHQYGRMRCWINDELLTLTDEDIDQDGIDNPDDNCPTVYNPGQDDSDADTVGNFCDNCELTPNRDQLDGDADGLGDVCDDCTDSDNDGYGNPGYVLNVCPDDNCPYDWNPFQSDFDGDLYGDSCDNCPDIYNEYQYDKDDDGEGDACEAEGVYLQCCLDLEDAYYLEPYSYQFWAVGGVEPYSWRKGIGQLPFGLSLDVNTGLMSGTPSWKADYFFQVIVEDQMGAEDTIGINMTIDDPPPPAWVCGDADASGEVDIDDVVYMANYIFSGGPAPDPLESGDADCSGGVDIDDMKQLGDNWLSTLCSSDWEV